jgi:hypothetical protein
MSFPDLRENPAFRDAFAGCANGIVQSLAELLVAKSLENPKEGETAEFRLGEIRSMGRVIQEMQTLTAEQIQIVRPVARLKPLNSMQPNKPEQEKA